MPWSTETLRAQRLGFGTMLNPPEKTSPVPLPEHTDPKVDCSLLRRWSNLLLCSGCLKKGIRKPLAQVISARHRMRTLCPGCLGKVANDPANRRSGSG